MRINEEALNGRCFKAAVNLYASLLINRKATKIDSRGIRDLMNLANCLKVETKKFFELKENLNVTKVEVIENKLTEQGKEEFKQEVADFTKDHYVLNTKTKVFDDKLVCVITYVWRDK